MRINFWRKAKLAIGAIFKNEEPYILEWIAYHRTLGVEEFYIADNNSDDGTTNLLAALHSAGIIRYFPFPHLPNQPPQLPAYQEIMRRFGKRTDWIAFIDADEFLLANDCNERMSDLLRNLNPSIGAVAVNWAIYGSSSHEIFSDELVMERFSKRARDNFGANFHYKSIVRTSAYRSTSNNPHHFLLSRGHTYTHLDGSKLVEHPKRGLGLSDQIHWKPFRINHYVVKSKQEFEQRKSARGRATTFENKRNCRFFENHDRNDVFDPISSDIVSDTNREISKIKQAINI